MTRHARHAPHGIPVTTCRNLQCDRKHSVDGLCHQHYKRVLAEKSIAPAIGQLEPRRSTGPKRDLMPGRIAEIDAILADGGDLATWARNLPITIQSLGDAARRLGRFDIERLCARLDRRVLKGTI